MSSVVGGELAAMGVAASALADETDTLRRLGWRVEDAITTFVHASSEGVPSIGDHEELFEDLVAGLRSVHELVAGTAHELARVDGTPVRRWVPGHDTYGRFDGWGQIVHDLNARGPDAASWLPFTAAAGAARDVWGSTEELATSRGWRSMVRSMDRTAGHVRARAARLTTAIARPAASMWRAAGGSTPTLARVAERSSQIVARAGAAARWAAESPGLARAGAGIAVLSAVVTLVDDEATNEEKVLSGLGAVGSVALLATGPVAVAGAVIVAGVLIYEHREAIADGARATADWIGDRAQGAGELVGEAGDWAVETAGDLLDGARGLLDGLF